VPSANPSAGNARFPLGTYFGYDRSAIIYTSAEISATGTITSVGFYLNNVSSPGAAPTRIFLKTTTASSFASATTVATEETGATLVYSGTLPAASFVAGQWVTIPLTTTFPYNGTSNLEVIVETNATGSGNEGSSSKRFRYSTATNGLQTWSQDTSAPTTTGTIGNNRPNVQLGGLTPLACAAPTGVAASSVTSTSASIGFTAGNGNTGYTVTYTPQGGSALTATGTASPVALSGLTPGTQYAVTVTGNCAGGQTATSSSAYTFTTLPPPPANDECSGATPISSIGVGSCGTAVAGTNVGATASSTTGTPAPGCASYSGGDVWFSLIVPANGVVQVTTNQGSGTSLSDTGLALYSGACGSLTLISCDDDGGPDAFSLIRATGLTPGSTIYARVWEYSNDATGSFSICAQTDPACGAPTAVTAAGVTSTSASIGFTAGPGNTGYTVTYTPQGGSALTATGTASPVALSGLTPNTQYSVTVTGNCAGGATATSAPAYTFTTPPPPPANDECAAATPISSIGVGACGTAVAGTNAGATASSTTGTPAPGCASYSGGDVWFSLIVPANGVVQVTTDQGSGTSLSDTGLALYSGACGNLALISCDDDSGPGAFSQVRATGLTPGSTIYARVWEYSNDATGSFSICAQTDPACGAPTNLTATGVTSTSATLNFTAGAGNTSFYVGYAPQNGTATILTPTASPVQLTGLTPATTYFVTVQGNCGGGQTSGQTPLTFTTPAAPPANDECSGAIALSSATTCTTVTGSTIGATASTAAGTCAGTADDDVWYSFVASSTTHTITVTGNSSFDAVVNLRAGSCPGATVGSCLDATGSGSTETLTASGLTIGDTYYVRVFSYSSTLPTTAATGGFTICLTEPAPCAAPTGVAASSVTSTSASIGFTAGNGNTGYTVTYTPQGGAALTATGTASPVALSGLTPGTQYAVTVTGNCAGGQTATSSPAYTFTTLLTPPANDECSGAIALTANSPSCAPTTGSTLGATASGAAGTCAGTADDDVWYSFVASASSHVITVTGNSGFDAVVNLRAGSCPGATVGSCLDATGSGSTETLTASGLTVGQTYYVRVYSYSSTLPTTAAAGGFTICITEPVGNLTVSSLQAVQGTYNNVTITGSGVARLSGPLTVSGTLTVQSGGILATNCQPVTGAGSFVLQAGGHLRICDAQGITSSGATGAVQLTGTRTYSPDAIYAYNGSTAQVTGAGLPSQVRALIVRNASGLTLSNSLQLRQGVLLNGGNLNTNGQALTLLSSATGTALVVNNGGVVNGTATVQRYIDPSLNPGPGYRHYAAPVSNTTVADLATAAFAPVVNPAYNAATNPGSVTPFPTVFGYEEARVLSSPATTYSAFDKGWVSPASLAAPLEVGRGYTVNIPATQLVDFSGTLNNGPVNRQLTRAGGVDGGLHLVGNPYPAPMDWSQVNVPAGLDNALYVYQSTSQYGGAYRSYVNGVGDPRIATGQGFFVRLTPGQNNASLTLTNAVRDTAFVTGPSFNRGVETRPLVQLTLRGTGSALADEAYVYFEAGATPGVDARYDAVKLQHNAGPVPTVYALAAGAELSINGLPQLSSSTVVPLGVALPAAGSFTFEAAQLLNLTTASVYLHDAVTGQDIDLRQQPRYAFTAAAGALPARFALRFEPQRPTANQPAGLTAGAVTLFPNPAHQAFTAQVPAVAGAAKVQATLLNSLGQVVRRQTVALPAAGAQLTVDVTGLATGVYSLQLQAGAALVTKRVVVE
jgi:hypothetical protein